MKPFTKTIIIVAGVLVLAFVAFSVYVYVVGGSGVPTRDVQARRVEPDVSATPGEEDDPAPPVVYGVVPGRSEARFLIDEILRNTPNTVVGRTDQVDGSIALRRDPAYIEVGEFEINLRAIATDDEMRDRTIRGMILETNKDEFEFSTFQPTSLEGVPDVIAVNSSVDLKLTGDLTVRDVTRSVTFDMTITVSSENEIRGSATTSFTWDEFEITIPYVGGNSIVSAVDDTVRIELEFVATAEE